MHSKHAEDLAQRILEQLDSAWCVKLKELKDEIEELLGHFKNLKGKDRIAGCRTWARFCLEKLHRTDRAVRKMLAAANAKAQQNSAEQSSASPKTEERSESGEKKGTEDEQRRTAKEKSPLSKAEEERIAKGQAISKTVGYLDRFDSEEFRAKFAEFWREIRKEFGDKIASGGAKKPTATATLESVPEPMEVA